MNILHFALNQLTGRFPEAEARALCYVLGPLSAAVMLHWRNYGKVWSVRFHAFHSLLMAVLWGLSWLALRGAEAVSPWFLGMVARQLRFTVNLGFALVWVLLLIMAFTGSRMAIVPFLHSEAVRLARRFERRHRIEGLSFYDKH